MSSESTQCEEVYLIYVFVRRDWEGGKRAEVEDAREEEHWERRLGEEDRDRELMVEDRELGSFSCAVRGKGVGMYL